MGSAAELGGESACMLAAVAASAPGGARAQREGRCKMRAAWEAAGCERCCARHKVLSTAVRRVQRSVLGSLKERLRREGALPWPGLAPLKARLGLGFHPMKEQHSPPPTARQQPSALSLSCSHRAHTRIGEESRSARHSNQAAPRVHVSKRPISRPMRAEARRAVAEPLPSACERRAARWTTQDSGVRVPLLKITCHP